MLQVWTMKLTESANFCCTIDRVVCTVKETLMECDGFPEIFMWSMDSSQRIKDLLIKKI